MTLWLLILAYLLGSIPFGLILTRLAGLGDVRAIGSGNIGATNVMRTGRKGLAVMTLLCDAGKGLLAVSLMRYYDISYAPLAGILAILGHVFPVWLKFKGGKGVATAIGVIFGLNGLLGAIVCMMWVAVFLVTGFSSLSAIIALSASAIVAFLLSDAMTGLACLVIAGFIVYTHRANIARLKTGTEHRFRKPLI